MNRFAKLSGEDLDTDSEFVHPNVWERDEYEHFSRLVIGSRSGEVQLLLDLAKKLEGPFLVLYVLLTSRVGHEPGRYQSPELSWTDLELFLWTYHEYIEQDGRLHLWVISVANDGQLVFDNHNMVYAYGPLGEYESWLVAEGYRRGQVRIPSPHRHNYHRVFDVVEDELMKHFEWRWFPLEESDDP